MKKRVLYIIIAIAGLFVSCSDFLEREPMSAPMSGTFYNSEKEMDMGLTGLYSTIDWQNSPLSVNVSVQFNLNGFDDFGVNRKYVDISEGNYVTSHAHVAVFWNSAYKTIQNANAFIHGMERGKDNVDTKKYNTMRAEAIVLRAWAYFWLINIYGDVPLITTELKADEYYNRERLSKNAITQFLYQDLDNIVEFLDWRPSQQGRVSRSVAYGLKARIAFYNKDYSTAATATKLIIDNAGLGLNPVYLDLFRTTGQAINTNKEIMFELMYSTDNKKHNWIGMINGSRNANSYSEFFPTQSLVDQFECIDGKRIDESPLYDPKNPSENRDERLKYSISMHGDTVSSFRRHDFVYNINN